MSMCRSQDPILGKVTCSQPETTGVFIGDPPFDDLGSIDRQCFERKHLHDKEKRKNSNNYKADARRKIGFYEWPQHPGPRN